MYITTGTSKHYTVLNQQITVDEVRYTLESAPAALGAPVKLYADDGMCIREDTVADWTHPRIEGNTVILSNTAQAMPVEPDIQTIKEEKVKNSKEVLAQYLVDHPMTWTDGKQYSVTEDKQALLTGNIAAYQLAITLGQTAELTWNATGEVCMVWTFENLAALAVAIKAYVKPLVAYQQSYEVSVNACVTADAINAIPLDYSGVITNV